VILDRFRVDGQAAVVTGAGRGIGAATAVALAEAGADVVLSARTGADLEKVALRVEEAGRQAVMVPADLRDLDAVTGLVDTATDRFGRLDIVVNNVGGTVPCALMDTSAEYLEEAFHFNVSTAHALLRAAAPHLVAGLDRLDHRNELDHRTGRGTGSVVNISSVLGRVPGRGYLAYGTAKAALAHYTRLAARDLSPRVRVNAIAVGSVLTSALEFVAADEGTRQAMERATPLGRIGEPEEVAATVLYLCSPAGGYLTGKVLEVDGGLDQPNLDLGLPDLRPEAP
jgi:7-alpha-hydroxysteroid dehydrogenase